MTPAISKYCLLIFIQMMISNVHAGGLTAPFEIETSGVLPVSIRNPRLKNLNTWVENRFNSEGQLEELGSKLNKNIIWDDIIAKQIDDTKKNLLRGTLNSQNLSPSDSVGDITGAVNAYVNINVPVFAYGVTEDWTIAFALPVYKVDLSIDTGFVLSQNAQGVIDQVASSDPVKAKEMAIQLSHPLADKARTFGYKSLNSEHFYAVGDLKLISKYKVFDKDIDVVTFKSELSLPTGRGSDVDKLIELPTGDGQYDLGLGLVWDHLFYPKLTWNIYGNINIQLPDRINRRIPEGSDGGLTPDKELVDRDSGDQYLMGTSIQFGSAQGGFYANMGYVYQYMQPTKFTGSLFARERYNWLESQFGSQQLISSLGQLGYSTIESYRAKDFAVPLQASIGFGHPIGGIDSTAADVYLAELVLFF